MEDRAVPTYTETDESGLLPWVEQVAARAVELGLPVTRLSERAQQKDIKSISQGTASLGSSLEISVTKHKIVTNFFRLVRAGQTQSVGLFVHSGLVSPDVLDWGAEDIDNDSQAPLRPCDPRDPGSGTTPLLAAVDAGSASMVRMLVSLGADVNLLALPPRRNGRLAGTAHRKSWKPPKSRSDPSHGFYVVEEGRCRRTPLMLAAADGRLVLVRLLLTELYADDSIVAPDGQLALRLAADAGHREIVALLPTRRGGSWHRFRANNAHAMHRATRAARSIYHFTAQTCTIVGWKLPRFIVIEILARPLVQGLKYAWHHRREALDALLRLPQDLWRLVRELGSALLRLPRQMWQLMRDIGSVAVTLAKALPPSAIRLAGLWAVQSVGRVGQSIGRAVLRAIAAVHTVAAAIVAAMARLRTVSLKDVWNGLCVAARATFVDIPLSLVDTIGSLGTHAYEILSTLFGVFGELLVYLAVAIFCFIAFVPKRFWRVLCAMSSSLSGGYREARVWIDPKYSS